MAAFSRRSLLRGLLASAAFPAWQRSAAAKQKLGVALLGLGNYSTYQLAPALTLTQHCQLTGIITGSAEKIPLWQQRYGIADSNVYHYDDMHRLADNPAIDVVYVVVPTALHLKYAKLAAQAGKHVWCEKPMAMTVQQCQQMIEACAQNKMSLSIGYRMMHEPNTQRFYRYASRRPFGQLSSITSLAGYSGNGLPASNWRMQKQMGGGALYDMGVYAINGARHFAGSEPTAVTATFDKSHPEMFTDVDETTLFTLTFANGLEAQCGASVVKGFNRLRADCEQGWYQLSPMQTYSGVRGQQSDGKHYPAFNGSQQAKQMDDNALAILHQTALIAPGEEGLKDIAIVEAVLHAAHQGKSITI